MEVSPHQGGTTQARVAYPCLCSPPCACGGHPGQGVTHTHTHPGQRASHTHARARAHTHTHTMCRLHGHRCVCVEGQRCGCLSRVKDAGVSSTGQVKGPKGCAYSYVEVMACPSGCVNGGGQVPPHTHHRAHTPSHTPPSHARTCLPPHHTHTHTHNQSTRALTPGQSWPRPSDCVHPGGQRPPAPPPNDPLSHCRRSWHSAPSAAASSLSDSCFFSFSLGQ